MNKLAHTSLAFALLVSLGCGDSSSSSSQGGDGSGNGSNNGGNGNGGDGGGNGGDNTGANGGGPATGGGGTGGISGQCPTVTNNLPMGECDLYLQNCPSQDDTCDIGDADPSNQIFEPIPQCFTQNGLKAIGETCNEPPDCQAGLTCVGNRCSSFCCPDDPNSCGGGTCNVDVSLQDMNGMDTGFEFKACAFSPTCELFNPDSCPTGENCYFNGPGVSTCYTPADGEGNELPEGAVCMALNDCADSTVCVGDGPGGMDDLCRFMCIINSGAAPGLGGCPVGQSCDTNALETGFPMVGFCHP